VLSGKPVSVALTATGSLPAPGSGEQLTLLSSSLATVPYSKKHSLTSESFGVTNALSVAVVRPTTLEGSVLARGPVGSVVTSRTVLELSPAALFAWMR
jgi:hypothetical protein